MFRVVTLNVRGLNPKKLDLISEFFSDKQLDFACIQETMISDVSSQNALAKKMERPQFLVSGHWSERGRYCSLFP